MSEKSNVQKMSGKSLDVRKESIANLLQLFPAAAAEGGKKIDFDKLRTLLSDDIDDRPERFDFTWNGKRQAMVVANEPSSATLLPRRDKSVDWDNTRNLFIEGDNLEVLKLLQKTYANRVRVIYIDPPYNTGKDFVYHDDFSNEMGNYLKQTGQIDNDGNRMTTNTDTNGRFHSDWLNMMYPRLRLARTLLDEQGVIFISIDDNEQENLKKVCNEIFGEQNFLAQVIWKRAFAPINLKKNFSTSHDYILVYGKNSSILQTNGIARSNEADDRYQNPDNDPRGVWQSDNLSVGPAVVANIYPITTPSGRVVEPPAGRSWRLSRQAFRERLQDNRIWFGPDGNGVPRMKRFLSELRKTGITPMTVWSYEEGGHSQSATKDLQKLMGGKKYFDYPKPVALIQRCIQLYTDSDSIVMDFFAGSGTTAQAVMQQNIDDSGNRQFIMVQLPEETDTKSEAYKDGYKTICDLSEERIRRAADKFRADYPLESQDKDFGFRTFELASSNMPAWDTNPEHLMQQLEIDQQFTPGRTTEDVLYELLLKEGLDLSASYTKTSFGSYDIYSIENGELFVVLGKDADFEVGQQLIDMDSDFKEDPTLISIIFQDSVFNSDDDKLNAIEDLKNAGFSESNIQTI